MLDNGLTYINHTYMSYLDNNIYDIIYMTRGNSWSVIVHHKNFSLTIRIQTKDLWFCRMDPNQPSVKISEYIIINITAHPLKNIQYMYKFNMTISNMGPTMTSRKKHRFHTKVQYLLNSIVWNSWFQSRLLSLWNLWILLDVQSTAHQTIHFGLCTALILKALGLTSNCKWIEWSAVLRT
jgi:hypothetical protein